MKRDEEASLRAAIKAVRQGRERPRFPRNLKDRIFEFVRRHHAEDESIRSIAERLGMRRQTLWNWKKHWDQPVAMLRTVEVVSEMPAPVERRVTVVGPGGSRVEDLSLDEVAELWRKLS